MEDWLDGMSQESECEKYAITSSRSLRRWQKEWGQGMYDECMEWSVAKLKKKQRMAGAGRPLEDPKLEEILLKFMKELKEDKLQFLTPLLVMEAIYHRPNWKGGLESAGFMGRVQNYIQLFMARNNLAWRAPTSIGQKLPVGWMGKWFCCSLFYFVKTEGVENKFAHNGDETKFWRTFVAKKQIAEKGAKEVHAGTDGDEKDGISTFLYTDADAVPQRPFFILQGEVAPNRPQLATNLKRKLGSWIQKR